MLFLKLFLNIFRFRIGVLEYYLDSDNIFCLDKNITDYSLCSLFYYLILFTTQIINIKFYCGIYMLYVFIKFDHNLCFRVYVIWNTYQVEMCSIIVSLLFQVEGFIKKQHEGMGSNHKIDHVNMQSQDSMINDIFSQEDIDKDGFISKDEFTGPKEDEPEEEDDDDDDDDDLKHDEL